MGTEARIGGEEIRNKTGGAGGILQQEHQVLHNYSFLKNSRFNGRTGETIQPALLNTLGVQTRKANQAASKPAKQQTEEGGNQRKGKSI